MPEWNSVGQAYVIILLPLYNGEKYLRQQLNSIINQQFKNFLIVCRDDGSSDHTLEILQEYTKKYPHLFYLIKIPQNNLGASAHFSFLMQYILEQGMMKGKQPVYVALSDQDDVWYPGKLARCITVMQQQEQLTPDLPIIVHSDLRVVNDKGDLIATSFAKFQGLQPKRNRLAAQLFTNTVTGCTALINSALLRQAIPIPPQAIMHDWWLALVTSAFGRICYIDEPLLDYRQHGTNTLGAREYVTPSIGYHFLGKLFDNKNGDIFELSIKQAKTFQEKYQNRLTIKQLLILRFATLLTEQTPPIRKLIVRLLRYL